MLRSLNRSSNSADQLTTMKRLQCVTCVESGTAPLSSLPGTCCRQTASCRLILIFSCSYSSLPMLRDVCGHSP